MFKTIYCNPTIGSCAATAANSVSHSSFLSSLAEEPGWPWGWEGSVDLRLNQPLGPAKLQADVKSSSTAKDLTKLTGCNQNGIFPREYGKLKNTYSINYIY